MTVPSLSADEVAWLTTTEMIEVDRVMIEDLGISLVQMMENAGRRLAEFVQRIAPSGPVTVAAGSGGNGGGGLVAARHLHNAGRDVTVVTTRPDRLSTTAAHQRDILRRMGVSIADEPPERIDVFVDAVVGYSLRGAPHGRAAQLMAVAATASQVISLDVPSGLDATTGRTPGAFVDADATITLAAPKVGLRRHGAVGDLFVADISVPRSAIERFGRAPRFGVSGIARVERAPS